MKITVGDATRWQQLNEEEAKTQAATQARQEQAATELAKRIATKGPVTYAGIVRNDAIGNPEIVLLVENISNTPVEAIEFFVAVFDKFGEPVPDVFGQSNKKVFKYQQTLKPQQSAIVKLGIPWQQTAGKATVMANRFVLPNDHIVQPPSPPIVEVRK